MLLKYVPPTKFVAHAGLLRVCSATLRAGGSPQRSANGCKSEDLQYGTPNATKN